MADQLTNTEVQPGGHFRQETPAGLGLPNHHTGEDMERNAMVEPAGYDPHRSTSVALTAVRTVLSRARTALDEIDNNRPGARFAYGSPEAAPLEDADRERMRKALAEVAELLAPWERHRRTAGGGRR